MADVAAESLAPAGPPAELVERATAGHGLRSVVQPIVDLSRLTIVGYESLTRFDAVDGHSFGPDRWFGAANALGIGARLDAAAIDLALTRRPDLPPNCFLTVNVDPDSLLDAIVLQAFAGHGHLGGVVIELTEHRPWSWAAVQPAVDRLRAAGARFAVDDAGAGHSGLQQVLDLRPSIIKLDRSLIAGIDRDEAKVALVEMLGLFASRIDAWVLAEGLETEAEMARIMALEVPLAQGYYLGRPEPTWAVLDPAVVADLRERVRPDRNTLFRLIEPVAPIDADADAAMVWSDGSDPWLPVVDADGRPTGLVDGEAR